MSAVILFCVLTVLLFVGKMVRLAIPLLQRLYLPSSVVGGLIGLITLCVFRQHIPAEWVSCVSKVPGFLINVIFAALFLGAVTPKFSQVIKSALPQLCLGQLLAWGQYVVGLGIVGFLLIRFFDIPAAFGNLLEIGFEGGHGTVGGMTEAFRDFGWEDGVALGVTVATAGMILGIVVGMAMVNWALNKGIISSVRTFSDRSIAERLGLHLDEQKPAAGRQTVLCDSIDSLAWHIALIGIAVLIGYGFLEALRYLEICLFPDASVRIFKGFPLFPLCMIGGIIIQQIAQKLKVNHLIDHGQMQRLSGAALDYLVVAAVATINIKAVTDNWLPLLIIILCGTVWNVCMVLFVAPKIFKDAWFERAIAEFGQSMGVTATGMMLLRTVDPESKTEAPAAFGYKQLLHEPIMGGGLWTAFALTLVFTVGWKTVWFISCVMVIIWAIAGVLIWKRNKKA